MQTNDGIQLVKRFDELCWFSLGTRKTKVRVRAQKQAQQRQTPERAKTPPSWAFGPANYPVHRASLKGKKIDMAQVGYGNVAARWLFLPSQAGRPSTGRLDSG